MKILNNTRRQGFTLVELMVVIVILGLLATLVVPKVVDKLGFANEKKAAADVTAIYNAVNEYALLNGGKFPDSLEALIAPDEHGRAILDREEVPTDPWGTPYFYEPPGPGQPKPRVGSYGKDGQPGGEGDDQDIDNVSVQSGGR
jgi:general secretion pathway protein G